ATSAAACAVSSLTSALCLPSSTTNDRNSSSPRRAEPLCARRPSPPPMSLNVLPRVLKRRHKSIRFARHLHFPQDSACVIHNADARAPAPSASEAGKGRKGEEHAMSQPVTTTIAVMGIDIGKNSFHVVGLDQRGAIVLRQRWSRGQVERRLANMPPCLVGMEACVGAHHLSRKLKGLGHDARLMPAKYVRPYSKGQKNDFRDAEAIAEAVQRPTMKFVATKTADQLDLQALH